MYTIKLSRKDNSIKITQSSKSIRLATTHPKIHLKNTGLRGQQGTPGEPGPQGNPGVQGIFGGNSVAFYFNTNTDSQSINDGEIRFNSSLYYTPDYRDVTAIYLSKKNADYLDVSTWISSMSTSQNDYKGYIRVFSIDQSANFCIFKLTGVTEVAQSYFALYVEPVYVVANFSGATVAVSFTENGDDGTASSGGGSGDKNYFTDFTVSDTIIVQHNLNKYPAVSVLDSAGDEVEGEVFYINTNSLRITFASPFSGSVTCN